MNKRRLFLPAFIAASFITAQPSHAQLISTLAGLGNGAPDAGFTGDGGRATLAKLNIPFDVAHSSNGDLYLTDKLNHRIRRIAANGIITTIAGTGTQGSSGDGGLATAATLNNPSAIALDASGNIYFSDNGTRIRRITAATGIINTIAGTGTAGFSGDGGMATSATFNGIADVTIGAGGAILVADASNHRVRRIEPITGIVTTIAGTGTSGFSGDGGAATSAALAFPTSVLQDALGDIYIADLNNKRIRRVSSTGTITTVAGDGSNNYQASGPALSIGLRGVSDLSANPAGGIYFAELQFPSPGSKLRSLSASGMVSTVVSGPTFGGTGHGGPLALAGINTLRGFTTDGAGNLYLADPDDSRIVMVCNNPTLPIDSATYAKPAQPDNAANPFIAMERCNVICQIGTSAPINTEIQFRTKMAAVAPMLAGRPFAKRYYDIQAPAAPATKGKLTFYFSQADFNGYNTNAASLGYALLPTGASDVAGRNNVVVMNFGGTGTAPGNYTGTTTSDTPGSAAIVFDPIAARWEVTVDTTTFGGFYLTSKRDTTTSVSQPFARTSNLRIYPTVTSGVVKVDVMSNRAETIEVLDAAGRRMLAISVKGMAQTIDLSALRAGVYLLRTKEAPPVRIVKQ